METPLLQTKLYIPPPRPELVSRPRLMERLNAGLHRKLTLVSAPAGFGKTTLVSEWLAGCEQPAAWLSLDESDNDPTRFLSYIIACPGRKAHPFYAKAQFSHLWWNGDLSILTLEANDELSSTKCCSARKTYLF